MSSFRVVIVGMGIQGEKRRRHAGADCVGCVEPTGGHDYTDLRDVPLESYEAAILSTPDAPKVDLLGYLADNGKHALVEKPLFAAEGVTIADLQARARANSAVHLTAYNHRFEPHFVNMRELISSRRLGRMYRCRMSYGNGTARLVRDSVWRDQSSGVLHDLGSHLLDTAAFWFGELGSEFQVISANTFENRALDHVVIGSEGSSPKLELEMSLLSWRNQFTAELFAEHGSAHIASLCKWGPSSFTVRTRVLPAGRPPEEVTTLVQDDPTWAAEYAHFKALCEGGARTDLSNDVWLNGLLDRLGDDRLHVAA